MKCAIILSMALAFTHHCIAESQKDPYWPCIQVLVPEISAASIWDGPSIENVKDGDIYRPGTEELVSGIVDRHEPLTESQLDGYLAQFDAEHHNTALTFLFNTLLDSFNTKRRQQISTIKRYTQSQDNAAKQIEKLMNQKSDLESRADAADELREIESALHWQKRMFKEREQAFSYLCELPQEIVQQAGEAARTISARLSY